MTIVNTPRPLPPKPLPPRPAVLPTAPPRPHRGNVYSFRAKLAQSLDPKVLETVKRFLLANLPGALSVSKSHKQNDRMGSDLIVEFAHNQYRSVDIKFRDEDCKQYRKDDVALEIWSVCESGVLGWTRDAHKLTDFIVFYWHDTQRCALVPFQPLVAVFSENW